MHFALIYPYLIPQIDKYIFDGFSTNKVTIISFSQQILDEGLKTRNYEQSCFALYFAIKHSFSLENVEYEYLEKSNNPILLLLGYLYFEKQQNREMIRKLKVLAETLMQTDMNAYWLFIYEVLPQTKLRSYWKPMKKNDVTFINIEREV